MQVLVAEDEAKVAAAIAASLRKSGLAVDIAGNGEDAWYLAGTRDYAAIVLDLGLPKLDGFSVLKRLREDGMAAPILILSARGSWAERVAGINAGADDYLPKPFVSEELVARVHGLIRRSAGTVARKLGGPLIEVDQATATVTVQGRKINLTQMEYRLLLHLMTNAGKVVSVSVLAEALYSHHHDRDANTVEVLLGRLRKKIGRQFIETRRGFGYVFRGDGSA